jgi:hypothetical protein
MEDKRMADVFISYSSNDREKVIRIVGELKSHHVQVWFDEDQILPGDDLIEKIREGISQCKKYIICLSPSFEKKPPTSWVKAEFNMAIMKEHHGQKNVIIPVRIKKGGRIPDDIGDKAYADLTTKKRWQKNFPKLIKALSAE